MMPITWSIRLLNYFLRKVNPVGRDFIAFSKFCYFLLIMLIISIILVSASQQQ